MFSNLIFETYITARGVQYLSHCAIYFLLSSRYPDTEPNRSETGYRISAYHSILQILQLPK